MHDACGHGGCTYLRRVRRIRFRSGELRLGARARAAVGASAVEKRRDEQRPRLLLPRVRVEHLAATNAQRVVPVRRTRRNAASPTPRRVATGTYRHADVQQAQLADVPLEP
jgi:hypothetical protein